MEIAAFILSIVSILVTFSYRFYYLPRKERKDRVNAYLIERIQLLIGSVETLQDTCSKYAKLYDNARLYENYELEITPQEAWVELHMLFNRFLGKCDRLVATLEKFGDSKVKFVAGNKFQRLAECADKIGEDQGYLRDKVTDDNLWILMNEYPSLGYASKVDDGANQLIGTLNEIAASLHH